MSFYVFRMQNKKLVSINEYCGSRRDTHAVMSTDREIIFRKTLWRSARKRLSNTPDASSPNDSKVTQNRLFSRPVSPPQNQWCSHPKTQNDFFGPKHNNNVGFKVSSSRSKFSRISKVPTACVKLFFCCFYPIGRSFSKFKGARRFRGNPRQRV